MAEAAALTVRQATVDDAAKVAAVDVASWRAAYAGLMPQAYLNALSVDEKTVAWTASLRHDESRGRRTLVAEIEGDLAGYATVGADPEWLYLMYVAPDSWGAGVGRSLMQGAHEAMLDLGYNEAVLWVLESNVRARRFYESAGWRPDGGSQMNDYGGVELRAIRMVCSLRAS